MPSRKRRQSHVVTFIHEALESEKTHLAAAQERDQIQFEQNQQLQLKLINEIQGLRTDLESQQTQNLKQYISQLETQAELNKTLSQLSSKLDKLSG